MKYRKKPVVIEAWQVNKDSVGMPAFLTSALNNGAIYYQGGELPYYTIETLEGTMRANIGDYIIKGVKGELYPCKPDIFAQTYEAVK